MNIRIIEDDQHIAELIKVILRYHTEETTVETTTSDFASLLEHEPWEGIDVAFIDLMLPGIQGEDIARWLRDNEPGVRRIVVSAKSPPPADRYQWCNVYISKPFDKETILAALIPEQP